MKVINCNVNQLLGINNKLKLFSYLFEKLSLIALAVLFLSSSSVFAQTLYGIISDGTSSGYLVTINTSTGDATLVGDTGLSQPLGLTYNEATGLLYAIDNTVPPPLDQVYSINMATGAADPLTSPALVSDPRALAYRPDDGFFYTTQPGLDSESEIWRLDSGTGTRIDPIIGFVGRTMMEALAVRPADGELFGASGLALRETIFRIPILGGTPGRDIETDIYTTGRIILGLGFAPDSTLYGSDGENLVTIDTSDGTTTTVGAFGGDIGTISAIAFAPDPGGDIDIWLKDCRDDNGNIPSHPSPCPEYWTSTDIWIDNGIGDWIIDAPVEDEDNTVKAYIRNRGSGIANDVTVSFYYRDNSTGLVFPDGATLIGTDTVTVSPDSAVVASVTWTALPAPPETGGHWCIGVVLEHPDDPAVSPVAQPYNDNNVGIANLWFIAGRAGRSIPLPFSAGTGGQSGFGLTPWPRDFKLKVISKLPAGWDWSMEGIDANKPFTLKLGEERSTALKIKVAGDAKPHSGGQIEVQQVDLETGTIVGGVRYNLYEDHLPPKQVDKLKASLVDGKAVLTWQATLIEAETGLRERVAYYEIIRNGEPLTKVLRDSDPHQPGMQWIDPDLLKKTTDYAVRVVDEGGNISKSSNQVTLKIPAATDIFNWLTWFLLILLFILMAWCIKTKKLQA